jgi:subtilisin family serine protease
LSRSDRDETIVLPNEILLSLDPTTEQAELQTLLQRYNLEIVRPVPFAKTQYVVRSKTASGLAILGLADQLNGVPGIRSASPNFVQSIPYQVRGQSSLSPSNLSETPNAAGALQEQLQQLSGTASPTPYKSKLLPLQWHLDSRPQRQRSLPRTDIRAVEAWQQAQNDGEGVVVAVIDSLIQWDHPDLAANLHDVGKVDNLLPGEKHGWDFAQDDPDTRMSAEELQVVLPTFQDSFRLATPDLLKKYEYLTYGLQYVYPNASQGELAQLVRNYLRNEVAAEFHGTWSAGVIAAQSPDGQGVMGVAPKAKILPVRVFGLGGAITVDSLLGAVRYAAARKADVINLSLGGLLPAPGSVETFFEVLDQNPNLVIVASAGNENLDGVAFPAAIPGVISVGATNLEGHRTVYSSYGGRLDVVAPGGDTSKVKSGGILTTGGTFPGGFWQGLTVPGYSWGVALDSLGKYVQVQGTSFSAPAVAGVVALMRGEDPQRQLSRDRLITILKQSTGYQDLSIAPADTVTYRLKTALGFGIDPRLRPSGVFPLPEPIAPEQYYYGSGLVNAEAAVLGVK